MNYEKRIVIDPEIRSGKPCIKGTRITVYDILEYLAGGMADLAVQIVDTGIATGGGVGFVHTDPIPAGERPAIVFSVINAGTAVSERWQFTLNLPAPDGRFTSELQLPLAPGEGRRFTIGFSELLRQGENQATVTVFPWKGSGDANAANDAATALLTRGY